MDEGKTCLVHLVFINFKKQLLMADKQVVSEVKVLGLVRLNRNQLKSVK